jgi:hypothetical protein
VEVHEAGSAEHVLDFHAAVFGTKHPQ